MKGTRHSEEQIIAILKQGEAGLTTAELCRQQTKSLIFWATVCCRGTRIRSSLGTNKPCE